MAEIERSKNYYLFRSCREIELSNEIGLVGYGWDDIPFCEFDSAEKIIDEISKIRGWAIGRQSNQIRRFKSITKGDILVVPYWGTVIIAEALGEQIYAGPNSPFYGKNGCNQHRVKFHTDTAGKVKIVPRNQISERLQKRLKIRASLTDLTFLKDDIDPIIQSLNKGEDYSYSNEIEKKALNNLNDSKKKLLFNIQTGKTGLRSGGLGLEFLVKELLNIDGFDDAKILPKTHFPSHADADIVTSKPERLRKEAALYLIQVKHHAGSTGLWGIEQLSQISTLKCGQYDNHQLVLVTSGSVSPAVRSQADSQSVFIIEGTELVDWIFESIPKLSSNTKLALGIVEDPQVIS